MKLTPDQGQRIMSSLLMCGFMSTALSGMFAFLQFGVSLDWLTVWGRSILIAWPVAMTLDLLCGAHIRALASSIAKRIPLLH